MHTLTVLAATIMGLVQGLTEFLPVSSSAHLVFADHFLRLRLSEADTVSFDVLLHLGTLLAVVVYFRRDVWLLLRGAGRLLVRPVAAWRDDMYSRLVVLLVVGTVPAAVAGLTLQDFFSQAFQNVPGTAALLFVTAAMLFWITRRPSGGREMGEANWKDALLVGAFQALAILPGISRSGSTITAGLLRGLDREAAPRFSFLLSIPIILGGGLVDLKDALETGFTLPVPAMVAGFIAAAVSGYLAVVLLLGIVRRGRLDRFGYYCVGAAVVMLAYWTLLVPKIDLGAQRGTLGLVGGEVAAVWRGHELAAVELGQPLQLRVAVEPGLLPVTAVPAEVPVPDAHGHATYVPLPLRQQEGHQVFQSEQDYLVRPLGGVHALPAEGEVREIRVILRNAWGIEREVRLPLRVLPESLLRRTA